LVCILGVNAAEPCSGKSNRAILKKYSDNPVQVAIPVTKQDVHDFDSCCCCCWGEKVVFVGLDGKDSQFVMIGENGLFQ
jgi:hypothetical protein